MFETRTVGVHVGRGVQPRDRDRDSAESRRCRRSPPQELLELFYAELRRLAQHYMLGDRQGHSLQATAVVHEACLRLIDQSRVDWRGRRHFFAAGARAMRRVLIDHARRRGAPSAAVTGSASPSRGSSLSPAATSTPTSSST